MIRSQRFNSTPNTIQTAWHLWTQSILFLMNGFVLFIFFCGTWWWRPRWVYQSWSPSFIRDNISQPFGSAAYQSVYYSRFALVIFISMLLFLWILSGFYGLRRLAINGHMYVALSITFLTMWAMLSVGWASQNANVANSHAMQWVLVAIFSIIILAIRPNPKWIMAALIAGMLVQGLIGTLQVAHQSEIGIRTIDDDYLKIGIGLAEFNLDPEESGTSIVKSGEVRFLRAYGLTPHPNLLAGGLTMSLLAMIPLWLRKRWQWLATSLTAFGFWALLLTFSRASLGGLVVGLAFSLIGFWLIKQFNKDNRKLLVKIPLVLGIVFAVFFLMFGEFVRSRAGVGNEGNASVEARSVQDRRIYTEQAIDIIQEHPLLGIGVGNFPHESHVRLQNDPRELDLNGDNVHNFFLLAMSELGFVGISLLGLIFTTVTILHYRYWRQGLVKPVNISLLSGVVAWMAIGLFEGYMWTLLTHQVMLWGTLMASLIIEHPIDEDHNGNNRTQ